MRARRATLLSIQPIGTPFVPPICLSPPRLYLLAAPKAGRLLLPLLFPPARRSSCCNRSLDFAALSFARRTPTLGAPAPSRPVRLPLLIQPFPARRPPAPLPLRCRPPSSPPAPAAAAAPAAAPAPAPALQCRAGGLHSDCPLLRRPRRTLRPSAPSPAEPAVARERCGKRGSRLLASLWTRSRLFSHLATLFGLQPRVRALARLP